MDQNFSVGNTIYVNHVSPVPVPPNQDASEAERLAYDKANLWIGKILECRASDASHVFLRVMWLYWPDELPMGRQSYHGSRELVASNAVDIIDAQSVASHAEVSFWDENDDEVDAKLGERYWRQTFDVNKYAKWRKAGRKGGKRTISLSPVVRHCVCETEYNPDETMFKCTNKKCAIWNHEECLADVILEDVYVKSLCGELNDSIRVDAPPESPPSPSKKTMFSGILDTIAGRLSTPNDDGKEDNDGPTKPQTFQHRERPYSRSKPWYGKFSCTIKNEDALRADGRVVASIKELKKTAPKKSQSPKQHPGHLAEWQQVATCLRCGTSMS